MIHAHPQLVEMYEKRRLLHVRSLGRLLRIVPMLTAESCEAIVDACEKYGNWEEVYDGWERRTTQHMGKEIGLGKLPEVEKKVRRIFTDFTMPLLVAIGFEPSTYYEPFVIRYEHDGINRMERHVDAIGDMSGIVLLNEGYIGGNLFFEGGLRNTDQKVGEMILFPSKLEHRVQRVRRGSRYSLAFWFSGKFRRQV